MPRTASADVKYPVQFRMGAELFNLVCNAADEAEISRNRWITKAINELIDCEEPEPLPITARDLLCDKVTVMVRVDEGTLVRMNDECERIAMSRTVFLLDACLSKLSREEDAELEEAVEDDLDD